MWFQICAAGSQDVQVCFSSVNRTDRTNHCIIVPVAVLGKNILGAWPLIIWEATTAKRNYYRTN